MRPKFSYSTLGGRKHYNDILLFAQEAVFSTFLIRDIPKSLFSSFVYLDEINLKSVYNCG